MDKYIDRYITPTTIAPAIPPSPGRSRRRPGAADLRPGAGEGREARRGGRGESSGRPGVPGARAAHGGDKGWGDGWFDGKVYLDHIYIYIYIYICI